MDIITFLAEQKIKEAIEKGEFDNLSCKGKRIEIEDLSFVPEELRASYKILKNAGVLPEELQIQREIKQIEDLLEYCFDDEERGVLKRKLTEKQLRFNILMEKRGRSLAYYEYVNKINLKLSK
ncbi:DnaJ family domain-containing protein [Deferribacter abyssi]|uniref:DnaJ family domain-containing protein n=1 Tax=Deferribacter abyssi TaxID=213806 RepID=UPI003C29E234